VIGFELTEFVAVTVTVIRMPVSSCRAQR